MAEHRDEWDKLIDEGLKEADRGELLTPEESKEQMAAWKQEFLAKRTAA